MLLSKFKVKRDFECHHCQEISVSLDQGGELKTLGSDGPVEAVAEVEGGVGQHNVGLSQRAVLVHRHVLQSPVQDGGAAFPQRGLLLK